VFSTSFSPLSDQTSGRFLGFAECSLLRSGKLGFSLHASSGFFFPENSALSRVFPSHFGRPAALQTRYCVFVNKFVAPELPRRNAQDPNGMCPFFFNTNFFPL